MSNIIIDYKEITRLLPHAPPMVLVESAHWEGKDSLTSYTSEELIKPFICKEELPGWVLIEIAAQSSAIHSALAADQQNKSLDHGFLVGLNHWSCKRIPEGFGKLKISINTETVLGALILVGTKVFKEQDCIAQGQMKFHVEYKDSSN
ncbi:MAG: hypothetical protein HQL32_03215 [Planctomycetes bacterium]|nr:hypothetical protein [Planctomycetota bacterium]